MDNLELIFLSFVYLLRMTSTLLLLFGTLPLNIYNYWFHTSENAAFCADIYAWVQFLVCRFLCHILYVLHTLLKLIVRLVLFLCGVHCPSDRASTGAS
jgi:hypothetical protein